MEGHNPFSLAGKTALVTGASSGIGRATAIECSRMGAAVVLTARNAERLNETLAALEGSGHSCIAADLCREDDIDRLVAEMPRIDGLVCNAGISRPNLVQFIERQDIMESFDTNAFGSFMLVQKLLAAKKISKGASVVFTSSVAGTYCSYVGSAMYSATKGAIQGYVKAMALDVAPKGIRVNSVIPAIVDTGIFAQQTINLEQLQEMQEDKRRYPLRRFGRPEDVAYAIVYLLSDASAWVTGTGLLIDGGYTLL
jgi:NAD(P)-dependent dehydrogenase (short-subunit alcohol dehydrogenase family)